MSVLAQLKNRGIDDILVLCCDRLSGVPQPVGSVFPDADVQTCVVHLLRSAMKYESYKDRRAMAKDTRPIYTAATEQAAELAFKDFKTKWDTIALERF